MYTCMCVHTQVYTAVLYVGRNRGRGIADETNALYYRRVCVAERQKQHHDPREFQDNLIW
jgi:hypothetical protein